MAEERDYVIEQRGAQWCVLTEELRRGAIARFEQ
jgi:hypothetical protein